MELEELKKIKETDTGWRYLKEKSPVFEEKANEFISNASRYVDISKANIGDYNQETGFINFENGYNGNKKVIMSYVTKPINRDLDCQYKECKKIDFYLDETGNLVINESSGRLESKYGYSFDNTKGGILKTNYNYQVFTPTGIELMYRGYNDEISINFDQFDEHSHHLRNCIKGGYEPGLSEFNMDNVRPNLITNEPFFIELSRVLDNLGLVREIKCSLNENKKITDKKEEYRLNRLVMDTKSVNPYLIHINRSIPPLAYRDNNNKFIINYRKDGLTEDNYKILAKELFVRSICDKITSFRQEISELSRKDKENRLVLGNQLNKYENLYRICCPDTKSVMEFMPRGFKTR